MTDPDRQQQSERFREAVDRKAADAEQRAEQEQSSLIADDRNQDELSPRAKNSGHGKKTADKWNQ
jgi:hypothetical protein